MNVNFIDRMMCSGTCPCAGGDSGHWNEAYNETALNDRHRTWNAQAKDLNTPKPKYPMSFTDSGTTFSTFEECYN